MKEAIERTFEPPEVHHERLFVISVLGFIVNLVGIFVFQHGGQGHHHHGGGACSHSHSTKTHSHHHHIHDHNLHGYSHYEAPTMVTERQHASSGGVVTLDMNGFSSSPPPNYSSAIHNHGHHHIHHQHDHHNQNHQNHQNNHSFDMEPLIEPGVLKPKSSGRGQIMQSVFLHIVADTLGSVGVMISALLMNQFGWMIADPLCSLFIAILISISVFPLLRDSFYVLMQRVPVELEDKLPECLRRIESFTGVLSIHETHFWTLNSDTYIGCLKLEVAQAANHKDILANAKTLLNQLGVERVHIQIDQV